MPRYLITVYRPAGFDPVVDADAGMRPAITALNEAMVAAGIRVFVGGLQPPGRAVGLWPQADGSVQDGTGPVLHAGTFVDGFWVLDVADREAALVWGRKAAMACRATIEVRPFH